MKNKTYLKLIILISGILIIHACSTLDKTSKKVGGNNIFSPDSRESSIGEFEIIKIKMDTPCWVNTNPKNCPEYQDDNNQFMYIKSKMLTEKVSGKPTNQQYESMQKKTSFRYFKLLNKEIVDELFTKYSQCKERRDFCNQIFKEYESIQEIEPRNFEVLDHYWIKVNALWELNVLFAISYEDFYMDKIKIIEDKIILKLPKKINIYNDPPTIFID